MDTKQAVKLRRKPHYTTGELAAILRVGVSAVTRLIDSGELPGWRLPGGNRRVAHGTLVAWLRGRPGLESTLKWLEAA